MKMNVAEAKYLLDQTEEEIKWYEFCLNKLYDDVMITGMNKRVSEIRATMITNRDMLTEKKEKLEEAIFQAKVDYEEK